MRKAKLPVISMFFFGEETLKLQHSVALKIEALSLTR